MKEGPGSECPILSGTGLSCCCSKPWSSGWEVTARNTGDECGQFPQSLEMKTVSCGLLETAVFSIKLELFQVLYRALWATRS